jgi:hypothetical protein
VQGLYFGLSVLAVALVIRWCMQTDVKQEGGEYRGLFAMRRPAPGDISQKKPAAKAKRQPYDRPRAG